MSEIQGIRYPESNTKSIDLVAEIREARDLFTPPSLEYYQQLRAGVVDVIQDWKSMDRCNLRYEAVGLPDADPEIRHFVLPDIPSAVDRDQTEKVWGDDDIFSVRETKKQTKSYGLVNRDTEYSCVTNKDGSATFIKVAQGHMYIVPVDKDPIITMQGTLSECTALVAKSSKGELVVAHVSFSEKREIEGVIGFMKTLGIEPSDIRAVASVGEYQREADKHMNGHSRISTEEELVQYGLKQTNITSFEHTVESGFKNEDGSTYSVSKNISSPIIDSYGVYTAERDFSYGTRKYEGPYKNERVLPL
jgi:hypothetical protein